MTSSRAQELRTIAWLRLRNDWFSKSRKRIAIPALDIYTSEPHNQGRKLFMPPG
jgi:hypothetical protein